jgi:hypothetical protein
VLIGTDNSHFRKYLTTLGVSVIAGSLSLAGLFYNLQGDLMVKQEDLNQLTPAARATIEQRQAYLQIAADIAPFVLLAMVTAGILMCSFGLHGWFKRQGTADNREDLELRKLSFELQKLTDEQRVEVLEREVQASSNADDNSDELEGRTTRTPPKLVPNPQRSRVRSRILEVDALVTSKLKEQFGLERVLTQVGVPRSPQNREMHFDAVVRPINGDQGLVVEITYTENVKNLNNRLIDAGVHAAEGASALARVLGGGQYRPVAVIVHAGEGEFNRRIRDARWTLNQTFVQSIAILAFPLEELKNISPGQFAEALNSALAAADGNTVDGGH